VVVQLNQHGLQCRFGGADRESRSAPFAVPGRCAGLDREGCVFANRWTISIGAADPLWHDESAMTQGLVPRAVRAAVFAAACVTLSAVTHAVAAPGAIPLWAVLIALGAVYLVALSGTGRERGLAAICGLAVAVQLSLDFWFSLAQVNDSIVRDCGLIQALPQMGDSITCAQRAVHAAGPMHVSPGLLIGQLIVAVVCAWPLYLGESAQHALWLWLSARGLDLRSAINVALATALHAEGRPAPARIEPAEPAAAPGLLLRFEVVRRGPPRGAVLAA
jgi:hypothetical protein